MVFELISTEPTNAAIVKEKLKKIEKRDGELSFRSQKTMEHLNEFCKLDVKKASELMQKLLDLNVSRLREQHYCKIIDIMPTHANDVKIALQAYNIAVSQDSCKKIAEVVEEYVW